MSEIPFESKIFGIPLPEALQTAKGYSFVNENNDQQKTEKELKDTEVPLIVLRCIEYIEKHGLCEEGIYRLSANQTELKSLRDKFDSGKDVNLEEEHIDINCITGVLKSFLREIPDPLLTNGLRLEFAQAACNN